jgi:hypothetical protein
MSSTSKTLGDNNMLRSESIKNIAQAVVSAQGQLVSAPKNSENPYFNSKYADLATCMDTLRPVLSKNGLAVMQFPVTSETQLEVETVLMHNSGEWIACQVGCRPKDMSPQSIGSAITYLRRYGLSVIGLVTDADDDGNAAMSGSGPRIDDKKLGSKTVQSAVVSPRNPLVGILSEVVEKTFEDKKSHEKRPYYMIAMPNGVKMATYDIDVGRDIAKYVGKMVEIPFTTSAKGYMNFSSFSILEDSKEVEKDTELPF